MRLERPSYTQEYDPGTFLADSGSVYLVGEEIHEQRSDIAPSGDEVRILRILHPSKDSISLRASGYGEADLYDSIAIGDLLSGLGAPLYVDITSMEHRTWAPLVRAVVDRSLDAKFVYVQPRAYTRAVDPLPGLFWDLSAELEGIAPLPGFIKLRRDPSKPVRFVPLLGFEGNRLEHMLLTEDIDRADIIPIVGSPGFRIEYPTQTMLANQGVLGEGFVFNQLEYAKANCPFDLYFLIDHLRTRHSSATFVVAPIGTKPHSLGAILQAIAHPADTELLYDHPVRKDSRTRGGGRVCVYDVGTFTREVLLRQ